MKLFKYSNIKSFKFNGGNKILKHYSSYNHNKHIKKSNPSNSNIYQSIQTVLQNEFGIHSLTGIQWNTLYYSTNKLFDQLRKNRISLYKKRNYISSRSNLPRNIKTYFRSKLFILNKYSKLRNKSTQSIHNKNNILCVASETGSGKSFAYIIPSLINLCNKRSISPNIIPYSFQNDFLYNSSPRILIIVPTIELSLQASSILNRIKKSANQIDINNVKNTNNVKDIVNEKELFGTLLKSNNHKKLQNLKITSIIDNLTKTNNMMNNNKFPDISITTFDYIKDISKKSSQLKKFLGRTETIIIDELDKMLIEHKSILNSLKPFIVNKFKNNKEFIIGRGRRQKKRLYPLFIKPNMRNMIITFATNKDQLARYITKETDIKNNTIVIDEKLWNNEDKDISNKLMKPSYYTNPEESFKSIPFLNSNSNFIFILNKSMNKPPNSINVDHLIINQEYQEPNINYTNKIDILKDLIKARLLNRENNLSDIRRNKSIKWLILSDNIMKSNDIANKLGEIIPDIVKEDYKNINNIYKDSNFNLDLIKLHDISNLNFPKSDNWYDDNINDNNQDFKLLQSILNKSSKLLNLSIPNYLKYLYSKYNKDFIIINNNEKNSDDNIGIKRIKITCPEILERSSNLKPIQDLKIKENNFIKRNPFITLTNRFHRAIEIFKFANSGLIQNNSPILKSNKEKELFINQYLHNNSLVNNNNEDNNDPKLHIINKIIDKNFIPSLNILIGSNNESRGIDYFDLDCVIIYDLPKNFQDYIHKIGRTGRMGKKGNVVIFVNSSEVNKMFEFISSIKQTSNNLINNNINVYYGSNDFEKDQINPYIMNKIIEDVI